MAMIGQERRPIKRTLGLPDVYPQDPKQKEDELTADNLKHGYKYGPNISLHDEYGTARLQNIVPSKISSFFNSVLNRRKDVVSLQDSGRNKKQQFNAKVETFSPVTAKSKQATDAWFKDLSECSKALNHLAKKVPSFHKKEEIFWKLNEFSVPMQRAAWFIKIAASVTDTKNKKRTSSDPSTDWTLTLLRVLRDILVRIIDLQGSPSGLAGQSTLSHQNPSHSPAHLLHSAPGTPNPVSFGQPGMLQPGQPGTNNIPGCVPRPQSPTTDVESLAKQWKYSCQLLGYLYQAGMVDRQECLFWILELIERARSWDDPVVDFALPLALHFIHEVTLSEVCSRRMAFSCGLLLTEMLRDNEVLPTQSVLETAGVDPKPVEGHYAVLLAPQKKPNCEPPPAASIHILAATLSELASCPHHRRTFFSLSTILQVIVLECTSACVWMSAPALKFATSPSGSPLDLLPLPPSMLPVPYKQNLDVVRRELLIAEEEIRKRSFSSECRWTNYFTTRDRTGTELRRFLRTIDALDRYAYDVMSSSNCIDTLYEAVYTDETKEGLKFPELFEALSEHGVDDGSTWDECVIMALCQWAVTARRFGEHRALVVAKLLEKRQAEVITLMTIAAAELRETMRPPKSGDVDAEKSISQSNVPIFQEYLFRFLDTKASVLENNASWNNKIEFSNLVHLYYELMRNDVFSHDLYMCTLISRGDLPVTKIEANSTEKFSANAMDTKSAPDSKQRFDAGMDLGLGLGLGLGLNANGLTTGDAKADLNDPMGLGSGKSGPNAIGSAEKVPSTSFFDDGHRGGVGLAMEFDEPRHDIDRLIERIDMDNSDSPTKDDTPLKSSLLSMSNRLLPEQESPNKNARGGDSEADPSSTAASRHVLYATHFPIPPEDIGGPPGGHEGNQRNILLFGVGRSRDCARHQVKKVTRDVTKLFAKKFSVDDGKGAQIKYDWNKAFEWDAVASRFSALPFYDQHQVITSGCSAMWELLVSYTMGAGNHLPVIDNFVHLTTLMEMANYITGLLDFCVQVLNTLPTVDDRLLKRKSQVQPYYVSPVTLHIVAVFRRYYNCLVLLPEIASAAFDGMVRLLQRVADPTACRASDRLMYSLVWDMFLLGHAMKWNLRVPDGTRVLEDAKSVLIGVSAPSTFNHKWDTTYMQEFLTEPKLIPDLRAVAAMRLREKADLRYSFVCSALQRVVKAPDNETVNHVALLCTEVVSICNLLSGDILGLLSCLLRAAPPYNDLRGPLNLGDPTAQLSIAVFVSVLIARQAILLEDFIKVAAVPCLMKAWNSNDGLPAGSSTEMLARLTCGILYRLYKVTDSPLQFQYPPPLGPSKDSRDRYLMHPCDKMLLWGANRGAGIGSILAVLKALLAVVDTAKPDEKKSRDHGKGSSNYVPEPTISDIIGTSESGHVDFDPTGSGVKSGQGFVPGRIETAPIHIYAQHVLSELCSQVWVRDRVLVADLCTTDFLMDSALTLPQMLKTLHSFCYPEVKGPIAATPEPKAATARLVNNIDVWNLKCAVVEIKLLSKHVNSNPAETRRWCDHVAGALLDPFYHHQLPMRDTPSSSPSVEKKRGNRSSTKEHKNEDRDMRPATPPADSSQHSKRKKERPKLDSETVWLIPCLIERVVPILHGPILRQCTTVLDNSEWWLRNREKEKEKELRAQAGERDREKDRDRDRDRDGDRTRDRAGKMNLHLGAEKSLSGVVGGSGSSPPSASIAAAGSPSYLKYPEQLSLLIRTCLRTVDEAIADHFVGGLLGQFQQFLTFHADKDRKKLFMVDQRVRQQVSDALLLRLHLLGWMYPYLALDGTKLHDLILTMVQFVIHGLVDFYTHNEVFYTIIDMLAGMVHMAIAPDKDADYSGRLDEMRKLYSSLGKRVRKELLDNNSTAVDFMRQLLPLPKRVVEIVAVEPMGTITDTKGNRVQGYDTELKYGLQVADKQRISPWEVVEGGRTPNVLQWTWYRGSKLERKLPRYQIAHKLLLYHTHNLAKDAGFYVEPLPLPEDDALEPPPEKIMKQEVKDAPESVDMKFGDRPMTGQVMGGAPTPNMAQNIAIKVPGPSPGGPMSNTATMNGPSSAGSASGGIQGGVANQAQSRKPQKRKRQARAVNGAAPPVVPPVPAQPPQVPPPQQQQQQQPMMNQPVQPQVGFNQMYSGAGNGPQQNWQGFNQPQNQPYYNQINPGGTRFERPMSQSKQAISNMLRQRHPNAQQFLQGPMVPNQQGAMGPGQPGMGVGQQSMVPGPQGAMVQQQQQPMGGQQAPMSNMQPMRPTTPMGPSSGPNANQVPQPGVMQQQNQPQQNPGGQMMRPPIANQRPGMFANQLGNQPGIGQANYMGGYNSQGGNQQGMMDVNNAGGGQMMANNAVPGNPGGNGGGAMPGGQFNVPMQQYQSSGAGIIRNQQPGGFVGQGNASQAGMQPRVPMNQMQRPYGIPNSTNIQGGQAMASGAANGAGMYGPRGTTMQNPQNMQFQQQNPSMMNMRQMPTNQMQPQHQTGMYNQQY